jgi:hypothetical protein
MNARRRDSWIEVRRFPYEEPYHTHLVVEASDGTFAGAVEFYCNIADISEIGTALGAFPSKVPDDYQYVCGSDDPRVYSYLALRAYTTHSLGHCALQFVMKMNVKEPGEGSCRFSITAEPASIDRLGRLFLRLHEKAPSSFRWTPSRR